MNKKMHSTIAECVSQELLVAEFYSLFARLFDEDREFWLRIMHEELEHGRLLQTRLQDLIVKGVLSEHDIPADLGAILIQGSSITDLFLDLQETAPSRTGAFVIALALENSISERHFHALAGEHFPKAVQDLFGSLAQDEKDHIKLIEQYAAECGISLCEKMVLDSSESTFKEILHQS